MPAYLAAVELAGAIGLIAGLFWWPIGVAAGVGVTAYFVGAIGAHVRVGDGKNAVAPAVIAVAAVIVLILRIVTA